MFIHSVERECGRGRRWQKKGKTTPDTGGKSNRDDDIQEERDDNMKVTMLKKTRTTRMTRIMGRVTQLRAYSENGNRSAVSTLQHK